VQTGGLADIVRDILILQARAFTSGDSGFTADNSGGLAGILFTGATTDIITLVAVDDESFKTGDGPFELATSTTLPAGLATSTNYWVRRISATTYKLCATKAAALDPGGAVVDITDTGTGNHTVLAVGAPTKIVTDDSTGDNDSFTAVNGDASFDSLLTAYATVAEQVNVLLAFIAAGTIDEGPETAGSGTIAVTDVDVGANSSNTTGVTFASALAIVQECEDAQLTLFEAISVCRRAVGLITVPTARNVPGTIDSVGVNGGDAISTCTTTDATTIAVAATNAGIEVWLEGMADNVAFMALQLDEVSDLAAAAVLIGNRAG
jgi:hypothetical protein